MSKIKEVSSFDGAAWSEAVPLGVDDINIDITGFTDNDPDDSMATIDSLNESDVIVIEGDNGASAWTKFNKFRKRVKNVFGNYIPTGWLFSTYKENTTDNNIYSAGVLNNYMQNVIGISGTSTATIIGQEQTLLNAINLLNNNINNLQIIPRELSEDNIEVDGGANRSLYFRDSITGYQIVSLIDTEITGATVQGGRAGNCTIYRSRRSLPQENGIYMATVHNWGTAVARIKVNITVGLQRIISNV